MLILRKFQKIPEQLLQQVIKKLDGLENMIEKKSFDSFDSIFLDVKVSQIQLSTTVSKNSSPQKASVSEVHNGILRYFLE